MDYVPLMMPGLADRFYPELQIRPNTVREYGISWGQETPRGSFTILLAPRGYSSGVVSATFRWWLLERRNRDREVLEVNVNLAMSYELPYDQVVGSVRNIMCNVRGTCSVEDLGKKVFGG